LAAPTINAFPFFDQRDQQRSTYAKEYAMSLSSRSYQRSLVVTCLVLCFVKSPAILAARENAELANISFSIKPQVLHEIDPRIFGQFMERPSWGEIGVEGALIPETGKIQPDVLRLLRQMEIPIIRFPGGTDVDFLDWCEMIDNVPGRSGGRPVSTGHRGHKVTNNFGYDEFLQFCEAAGAEAIVVVNFRDALLKKKPLRQAAMHAAALVAYCNAPVGAGFPKRETMRLGAPAKLPDGMYDWPSLRAKNGRTKPYGVRYFQIGNETWAFIDELQQLVPDGAPQFYVECLAAYIDAMRSVDPSIEIIVDGHDGNMRRIVGHVYEELGDRLSYLATHFYSPWAITKVLRNGKAIPAHELSAGDIWYAWVAVTQFDENGQSVLSHPGFDAARSRGYKVAVTEWNWNGWWRQRGAKPALDSSFAKGLGAAGYLHAFMRAGDVVKVGCQSMLVGNSWGITSIRADAQARRAPYYMPTGQITMFYSKHHGDKLLSVVSKNIPTYKQPYQMGGIRPKRKIAYIDALATATKDRIYFHAINRHFDRSIEVTIDVAAFSQAGRRVVHHVLEGRLNDAPKQGQPAQIGRISRTELGLSGKSLTAKLPRRSISCIEFVLR
jgi:alpha-N-arabinofuranosidase